MICRSGTLPFIRSSFPCSRLALLRDNELCTITLVKFTFGQPVCFTSLLCPCSFLI